MIKIFKYILLIVSLAGVVTAGAQTTSSSPYSQFGLGIIKGLPLPQNRAMGGIAVGLRNLSPVFNDINLSNPASYSTIHLTAFDAGASSGIYHLSKSNLSGKTFNATLSHLLFGIPVNKSSAFSFGIVPYSDLGYRFRISTVIDTTVTDHIYSGDGGMSKAYIGYGLLIGKHLSLGVNGGYLFGKLNNNLSTEFPEDIAALNTRTQNSRSIGGLNFDYGLQYSANLSSKVALTLGYSGTVARKIGSSSETVVTHYRKDPGTGIEFSAADTLFYTAGIKEKITMPMTQAFGFSLQQSGKWLFGADYSMSAWSDYREGTRNPGLKNSSVISAGGQITPNINSSKYLNVIDYRLGFRHEKTNININGTDINQTALTFGFGLPLLSSRNTYYRINFASEIGQRGTLSNNLVRERFVTFHLGFTMNDKWFLKYKFD